MKLKSLLYEKEQEIIINKIINIVGINDGKQITLYELDKNINIQNQILNLIPEIRKYFAFNNIKSVGEPEKQKRPWLSIIRHFTKSKYKLHRKDHRIYQENDIVIRTILYTFEKL